MKIGMVTDTSCNFTPTQAEELGIHLVPLDIIFEDQTYVDGYDLSIEDFYQKMNDSDELPSSSQPPVGRFVEVYEDILDDYDKIISIHLSADLSGTVETAQMAAEHVDPDKIIVYDSKLVSVLSAYLVVEAKRLIDQGASLDKVMERLDDARSKTVAFGGINSLDNIIQGGRLPSLAGKITEMIQLKVLIRITAEEGMAVEKVMRTSKRALRRLEKIAFDYVDTLDYPVIVEVAHGDIIETAEAYNKRLLKKHPEQKGEINRLTGVIGVHSGPEILGFTITPDYEKIDKLTI